MKSFRYYFEDFESRMKTGRKLELELADAMSKELSEIEKSNEFQIILPDLKYQTNWLINYIKSNAPINIQNKINLSESDPEKLLNSIESVDKFLYYKILGEFGAKFGDVVVGSNIKKNDNFETAKLFVDTKVGDKVSLRSLARFADNLSDKQIPYYLIKTGKTFVLIKYHRSIIANLVKYFNDSIIIANNLSKKATIDSLKNVSYHKSIPADIINNSKDFYKADSDDKGSGEIMVKLSKLKEISNENKEFSNLKEVSKFLVSKIL